MCVYITQWQKCNIRGIHAENPILYPQGFQSPINMAHCPNCLPRQHSIILSKTYLSYIQPFKPPLQAEYLMN